MKNRLMTIIISGLMIIFIACSPKYACKQTMPGARCASLSDIYEEEVLGITVEENEDDEVSASKDSAYEKRYYGTGTFPTLVVVSKQKSEEDKKEAEQINEKKEGTKTKAGIIKNIRNNEDRFPILRPPKIARIWIAPWIDGNGDLNMGSFIYTEIEGKKWIFGEETPVAGKFGNVTKEFINKSIDALK